MVKSILHCARFLLLLVCTQVFAQDQYYSSLLEVDKINLEYVNNTTYIDYGDVDNNELKLRVIESSNDGYAEFSLEPVLDAVIGLALSSDESVLFGFNFSISNFKLEVAGQSLILPNIDDSYSQGSTFKVEKCTDKINFYKDDQLLYSYCDSESIQSLIQRTNVVSGNGALLFLEFFENEQCQIPNIVYNNENEHSRSAVNNGVLIANQDLDNPVEPNRYVILKIQDQNGKYIRQYKKRTNSKGEILGIDEVKQFLKQDDFKLSIIVKD